MYADVPIPVGRVAPTMLVPSNAVATSTDGPFVIALRGDTAQWVRVRRGDAIGDKVEVFGDLHDGDHIAVRATDEIRSGARVRVAPGSAR